MCYECGELQLTREVPERHAKDGSLDLPDAADRDMGWGRLSSQIMTAFTETKSGRR